MKIVIFYFYTKIKINSVRNKHVWFIYQKSYKSNTENSLNYDARYKVFHCHPEWQIVKFNKTTPNDW